MKLSPRRTEQPELNLTPMIDVVFLLLLFFMISTSFVHISSLKVSLPKAQGNKTAIADKPVTIDITQQGQVLINKKVLSNTNQEHFKTLLKQVVGSKQDPYIIINADAKAPYQLVVTAMDSAQQLGYNKITLATHKK